MIFEMFPRLGLAVLIVAIDGLLALLAIGFVAVVGVVVCGVAAAMFVWDAIKVVAGART